MQFRSSARNWASPPPWCFLAVLAVTIAGFWPTFFRNPAAADAWHATHGISATLWIVVLAWQSWSMRRGLVAWHRRTAAAAVIVLLPVLVTSALRLVGVMQRNVAMPPEARLFFAFIDLPSMAFLVTLVALGLGSTRQPEAHWRFLSATVLIGMPAALSRLYGRVVFPTLHPLISFHASLLTVELILAALIVIDRRRGERHRAYPLSLAFFLVIHLLIGPVAASGWWRHAMEWYGRVAAASDAGYSASEPGAGAGVVTGRPGAGTRPGAPDSRSSA